MGTAPAPARIPEPPNVEGPKPSVGEGEGPNASRSRRSKIRIRFLITLVALVVVAASVLLYRYLAAWESTDDAQIDGYIYPVSSRVSGYVTRVLVDDNQYVQAGTVLVQLDPKDYDVALANAKATLANDQASAAALRINVPITSVNTSSQLSTAQADLENAKAGLVAAQRSFDAAQASLRQAEANDLKAQDDVNRYKPLAEKDEIPQQQYVQALHSQQATAAAVAAARASAAASEQAVTQARARIAQAETSVGAEVACSSGRCGNRARRRGASTSTIKPPVHDHCGSDQRGCRPKIRPARTERCTGPANDDHRSAGQPKYLGDRQLQGDTIKAYASGPACEDLGRHVRQKI